MRGRHLPDPPPKARSRWGHGSRRFAGLSLSPSLPTSNQNLVGGPTSFAGRPFGPRLPQLEALQPRGLARGSKGRASQEKRRRSCGGGRPMPGDEHGAGPPLCYSEPVKKRGVDGLTLAAPPRACGYPTLFPPPVGRGGFNVSRFPGPGRGTGAPAVVIHLNKPCSLGNSVAPFMCCSGAHAPEFTHAKTTKTLTTLSGGSLGSCVDEERS